VQRLFSFLSFIDTALSSTRLQTEILTSKTNKKIGVQRKSTLSKKNKEKSVLWWSDELSYNIKNVIYHFV